MGSAPLGRLLFLILCINLLLISGTTFLFNKQTEFIRLIRFSFNRNWSSFKVFFRLKALNSKSEKRFNYDSSVWNSNVLKIWTTAEPALGWGTVPYEPDIECQGPCDNRDDCFQQCNNIGFTKGGCCLGFNGSPVRDFICCCKRNTAD